MSNENDPSGWWYLSFVRVDPQPDEFIGGCVVEAASDRDAYGRTKILGINPGGEALIAWIPNKALPAEEYRNRLLSTEEIKAMWPDSKKLREFEEDGVDIDATDASFVCAAHAPRGSA